MDIMSYVRPELLVVAVVLYFLGMWLKQAAFIKDKYIPLVLGIVGIFVCGIYVASVATFATAQDILSALFAAITQGILVAGLSNYVNQIIKQIGKDEQRTSNRSLLICTSARKEKNYEYLQRCSRKKRN